MIDWAVGFASHSARACNSSGVLRYAVGLHEFIVILGETLSLMRMVVLLLLDVWSGFFLHHLQYFQVQCVCPFPTWTLWHDMDSMFDGELVGSCLFFRS